MTAPDTLDAVFGALADPHRREILGVLAHAGGASASTLARQLPLTRQGLAKHLAVLEGAGLVTRKRRGREVRYWPRAEQIRRVTAWMSSMAAEWDDRLAALARLAADPSSP